MTTVDDIAGHGLRKSLLRALAIGILTLQVAPAPAGDWYLLGREGGCFPVAPVLAKRLPEAADVHDPAAFVELMQGQGREVSREERPMPNGRLVAVHVPSLNLALGFGDAALCRHVPPE